MDNAALCLRDLSEEFLGESCEEEEEEGERQEKRVT